MDLEELAGAERLADLVALVLRNHLDEMADYCARLVQVGDYEAARAVADRCARLIANASDMYEEVTGAPLTVSCGLAARSG